MDKAAESKLNELLLRVGSYIEKHENLNPQSAQTVGKKLYGEIVWWLAEINKEKK